MDDSQPIPLLAIAAPFIPPMPALADTGYAAAHLANNIEPPLAPAPSVAQLAPPTPPPPATTTNTLAASSQILTKPLSPSISFDTILSELQAWQQQNNGCLTIPLSHPALARITDALTAVSIEKIVYQRWDEQLAQLRVYKTQHGNCNVALSHPTLGKWASEQREYYKLHEQQKPNPLTPSRFEQLRSLGLTVNRWEKRLEELRAYKAENDHCDVPLEYPQLGFWVLNQRDTYHFEREDMPQDRIDALEALGFNWNRWGRNRLKIREDAWDVQFNKLVEFIKANGHSNISQHDKENERLGKWIKNQRYEYRKYHNKGLGPSRLGRDRIDKLNEIGFQWRLRPERIPWDERLKALVQYKQDYGHCRVPMNIPELGKWAKYQRDQYCQFMRGKKAKINQQKIDKLLSIGFEESLEERVALGLSGEGEGGMEEEQDEGGLHHVKELDHVQEIAEVAYHHHGEQHVGQVIGEHAGQAYADQYLHGDSGHAYGSTHQGSGSAFHYQHGGVHYG